MTLIDFRVSPKTVQQVTVEKLRQAIITGVFKPGDRLLEAELCELLGVSRPSVREALRSLEAERLVAIVPNKGPHIPRLTWDQATEIYKVRALLEGEAASLAAQNATDESIKKMRVALSVFEKAARGADAAAEVNSTADFYAEILRSCNNSIIEEVLGGLLARVNFLRARSMSMPGRAKVSLKEMKSILDSIEARDSEAARRAAIHHVEQAYASAHEAYKREQLE
ncbi:MULTISPECIES: GntR family transcriptional regulator [unclassified Mesorhizobium]|uniref:GntR family transcriptional regulator n=1 Tax=unclassified Mesorhizobium TaxID=325217 RepID=UPI00241531BC|nr:MULTISPECIES: GntR family transcriptional regulator [unclassified Mesorhizobium]MDG4890085.1 GntR family transcriptional regulator [Mesorhizobium sp. WSM4887]MDG4904227.1 GntR family transcriptional regulator [Mesorhizobium sp. WSM4962]MDG4909254.1 GntR family transcriptional regulator [Mesorhizobium sp. WSM4898]MDG4921878.1 GntR family transcriptional regulator [Mesorhizobium sp. WSM4989]